jgi:peptide/nickel transport system permease protein
LSHSPDPPPPARASTAALQVRAAVRGLFARLLDLLVLVAVLLTLLFFALRLAGDPSIVLAGEDADAATLAEIRAQYGLDQPLPVQYLTYLANVARGDFGDSLATGQPALPTALAAAPATLLMAGLAMAFSLGVAIPLGVWLGAGGDRAGRRVVSGFVAVAQGVPGLVVALVLIQVFAVMLNWLPALGHAHPVHWILPTLALGWFLVPKLVRLVQANVAEAMREDYVRTARAIGAHGAALVWRHALPNALLGTVALVAAQLGFLVSGAVVIETIFAWPGLGRLLVQSTVNLDFPVVQALVVVVCVLVFAVNAVADLLFRVLDPRIRGGA